MELRNLVTFTHVAELGSFTKAADLLGYSQSTVSFQIKQLEEELDCLSAFVLGGAGDLTCGSRLDAGREDTNYVDHGKKLGAAAVEAAKNFVPLETGNIQLREFPFVAEDTAK